MRDGVEVGEYPGGWYYWYCKQGYLPDCEPIGPFDKEDDAIADMDGENYWE